MEHVHQGNGRTVVFIGAMIAAAAAVAVFAFHENNKPPLEKKLAKAGFQRVCVRTETVPVEGEKVERCIDVVWRCRSGSVCR